MGLSIEGLAGMVKNGFKANWAMTDLLPKLDEIRDR